MTVPAFFRPRFFSNYEWTYHLLMMPVLFPLGNYYFIGPRYFRDPVAFGIGTALVFGLYWLSIVTLTWAVRRVILRYPGVRQTVRRTVVMFLVVGSLTVFLAIFDVWTYSLVPALGLRFSWEAVRPIWVLGLVFDVSLCVALSLFYSYSQWSRDQTEDEQLQRQALQRQYDALKGQLNPHFLFNSLNSLSVLIGDDPERAERFVDQLAKVYRYLLQAGRQTDEPDAGGQAELVTLQAELDFIAIYAELLEVRFGKSLRIERPTRVGPVQALLLVPPLTLLTLLDNAIKHNAMSVEEPLVVRISLILIDWLEVRNNRQPKTILLKTGQAGLSSLTAKYRLLSEEPVSVEATDAFFRVRLPLLAVKSLG